MKTEPVVFHEPNFKHPCEESQITAIGNDRWVFQFENGYGASVIRGPYTYGGSEGLFELGVLKDGHLFYDSPITENCDVIGHLTAEEVDELCDRIASIQGGQ